MKVYGSNICLDNWGGDAKGKRGDGARSVWANAGKRVYGGDTPRKDAAMLTHNYFRRVFQSERPPIIAKPLPRLEDVADWRLGKCVGSRKFLEKGGEKRDAPISLRLLKHFSQNKNRVRILRLSPRKIPLVLSIVARDRLLKRLHARCAKFHGVILAPLSVFANDDF